MQQQLFDVDPKEKNTPLFDNMMADLKRLNKYGDDMNRLLTKMLNDLGGDEDKSIQQTTNQPKQMAKELSKEAIETLKNVTIDGMVVKLPPQQLEHNIYVEVKKRLELIGGKWKTGKVGGFVFNEDPTELLEQIANGEKRNIKKEFQFFGPPAEVADYLIELAMIKDGQLVLEPSAGQGAIIDAVFRAFPRNMQGPNDIPCVTVDYFELMPLNAKILGNKTSQWQNRVSNMGADFLTESNNDFFYDRIIANPPFNKNQDIDHIYKMHDRLKVGGRLVSIASKHWQFSSNKKEEAFKYWLNENNAEIHEIPAGSFKESGTQIATCIIVINK